MKKLLKNFQNKASEFLKKLTIAIYELLQWHLVLILVKQKLSKRTNGCQSDFDTAYHWALRQLVNDTQTVESLQMCVDCIRSFDKYTKFDEGVEAAIAHYQQLRKLKTETMQRRADDIKRMNPDRGSLQ